MAWFVIFFLYYENFISDRPAFCGLSAPAMLSENICVQWRDVIVQSIGFLWTGANFSNMHDHSRKLTASCQPYWNAPISNAQPDSRLRLLLSEILNVNGIARDLDGKLMISSILFPLLLLVESFPFVLLVFHLSTQGQKVLCSLLCSFTPRLWPQVWEFAAVGSVETVVKPIESQQKKRAALSFALQSHTKCLCNWPKQILKERAIQNDMKTLPSSQT